VSSSHGLLGPAHFEHSLSRYDSRIRAALRKQKRQEILEHIWVCRVAEKTSFALDVHQILVLELLQVMGNRGRLHSKFVLNLAGHHPVRVGSKKMVDNPEAWLGPQRRQDVGELDEINLLVRASQ
jgi:hypothetical protein